MVAITLMITRVAISSIKVNPHSNFLFFPIEIPAKIFSVMFFVLSKFLAGNNKAATCRKIYSIKNYNKIMLYMKEKNPYCLFQLPGWVAVETALLRVTGVPPLKLMLVLPV
jgi:hypothetical protein